MDKLVEEPHTYTGIKAFDFSTSRLTLRGDEFAKPNK